jgi:hypothetical protein
VPIDYSVFAFPKGGKKKAKAKAKPKRKSVGRDETAKVVSAVRKAVFVRDNFRCRNPECPADHDAVKNNPIETRLTCHELEKRSKTGGKPPEERFNTRVCISLCWHCHRAVEEGENPAGVNARMLKLYCLEPDRGADGMVKFEWEAMK